MSTQQHVSDASPASLSLFSLTAPVAMGYIPLGMVFGFLFVQAGASWVMALIASLVIYAGAAQYMMIPMLATGMPISAIALATLLVNLRHVFYGLSLLETFPKGRLLRWYTAFALTDETYSVLTTLPRDTPPQRMALLALLNQGWWVAGSLLGAIIGAQARVPLDGLDFVLCSLFAVLTVEQWRARQSALPLWTALISYALATVLIPDHALVLAIVLSILTGVFAFKWEDR
ncbi:MAG TPA: AzlC family ABC transporter permease [Burkholderiaceae bacterium]|nr:AzlC family ABC transporter permease [Burkholderiaceae bacterium]